MAASLAVLLLAACGSLDDIYSPGSNQPDNYEIRGTVDSIDLNGRSILLRDVSGYQSMLSGGNNTVRVYFDDQTTVSYQGQTYRPGDLERGDQVAVRVDESGNKLNAESMTVLHDVSGGGSVSSNLSTLRGTVRYVDTSRREIELESTSWISRFDSGSGTSTSRYIIRYDANTSVDVQGRLHPVANLERGDVIEVQTQNTSGSTLFAERIYLVRDVRN
jgi:hypothetical protein